MRSINVNLSDDLIRKVAVVSINLKRSKSCIAREAIQTFVDEYFDCQVALKRLNDKEDGIISSGQMHKLSGSS